MFCNSRKDASRAAYLKKYSTRKYSSLSCSAKVSFATRYNALVSKPSSICKMHGTLQILCNVTPFSLDDEDRPGRRNARR
jgi:hypothetical protein